MTERHDQEHPVPKGLATARPRSPSAAWAWYEWAFLLGILLLAGSVAVVHVHERRRARAEDPLKCARNLRQIGGAIKLYALDHAGACPPALTALYPEIAPECFICPETEKQPASGPTTQAIATALADPAHTSYTYLGGGMTASTATPDTLLAHCHPEYHHGRGMYVLYGDGRVDWVGNIEAQRILGEVASGHNPPRPATAPAAR